MTNQLTPNAAGAMQPLLDETSGEPILRVGTFGTHILKCPTGKYVFRGTLPEQLRSVVADTFIAAAMAFRSWFLSMPKDEQREHAANLRNDVFAFVFSR